ncbi:MAG: hypothetical protein P1U34_08640 [Coxiellaceae bacterium]|nr:hypothetical protein [Coxiellaceae bacterium]
MSRESLGAYLEALNANLKFSMYDPGRSDAEHNFAKVAEAMRDLTSSGSDIHAAVVALSNSGRESDRRAVTGFFQSLMQIIGNVRPQLMGTTEHRQLDAYIVSLNTLEANVNGMTIVLELNEIIDSEPDMRTVQQLFMQFQQAGNRCFALLNAPIEDDNQLVVKLALIELLQKLALYAAQRVGLSSEAESAVGQEAEAAAKPDWEACKSNAVTLFYAAADSLANSGYDHKTLLSMSINAFLHKNIVAGLTDYNAVTEETTWKPGAITEQQLKVWNTMILRLGAKEMMPAEEAKATLMGDCAEFITTLEDAVAARAAERSSCLRAAAFDDGGSVSSASDSGEDAASPLPSAPTEDELAVGIAAAAQREEEIAQRITVLHASIMAVPPPASQAIAVACEPPPSSAPTAAPTSAQLLAAQRRRLAPRAVAVPPPVTDSSGAVHDPANERNL